MFPLLKMVLLCCCISLVAGCASLGFFRSVYTKEALRHPDQEWWIKEDLARILARHLARQSRANPEEVDPEVARNVGKVVAICYRHGSFNGRDLDGGVRAMNFFKKVYFRAGGDYWTWREAVRAKRRTTSGDADSPSGGNAATIPEGYR